jgi:hypothetical protein
MEEIVFAKDLEQRKQYLQSQNDEIALEQIDNRQHRSGENARMCLSCHRQDPRPIWEAYPIWPGIYGQADDVLGSTTGYNMNGTELVPIDGAKELDEFTKFEKSAGAKSRYASLLNLQKRYVKNRGETGLNSQFNSLVAALNER